MKLLIAVKYINFTNTDILDLDYLDTSQLKQNSDTAPCEYIMFHYFIVAYNNAYRIFSINQKKVFLYRNWLLK